MAQETTQQLTLGAIIAAPLTAVINADANAINAFATFLQNVAFKPVSNTSRKSRRSSGADDPDISGSQLNTILDDLGENCGELRYVSFSYEHMVNGEQVTSAVRIPLLSLIPLPLLQVKEATFDFAVDVLCVEEDTEDVAQQVGLALTGADKSLRTPRMMASIAATTPKVRTRSDSSSVRTDINPTGKVNVHVEMQNADIPMGLANLLNLVSYGAESKAVSETTDNSETSDTSDTSGDEN